MQNYRRSRLQVYLAKWYLLIWVSFEMMVIIHANNETYGSCYVFIAYNNRTWNEGQEYCQKESGSLVSMETEEEWSFVNKGIQERNFSNNLNEWYIGLRNYSGTWMWVGNKSLTINKWQTGVTEPNRNGDCAVMAKNYPPGTEGLFKGRSCLRLKMFICEYDERNPVCRKTIMHCCNNGTTLEPSPAAYRPNVTNNQTFIPTEHSKAKRTALVVVVALLGLFLASGSLVFLYVFCWRLYNPGYQGYEKTNGAKRYKAMLRDSPGKNVSCSRTETLELMEDSQEEKLQQTNAICGSHADTLDYEGGEELDADNSGHQAVLFAQVHNLNSETSNPSKEDDSLGGIEEQNAPNEPDQPSGVVLYADGNTNRANSRGEESNFDFPPSSFGHDLDSSSPCANTIATNSDTIDIVATDSLENDTAVVDTVAIDTVTMETVDMENVAKDTIEHDNTWETRSPKKPTTELQSVMAKPGEEEDTGEGVVGEESHANEVIYATVNKPKPKVKPRVKTDNVVYAKVDKTRKQLNMKQV